MNTFDVKQAAMRSVEVVLGARFDATSHIHSAIVKGFIEGANYAMQKPKVLVTKRWNKQFAKEVVIEVVEEHFKITIETMKSRSRKSEVRFPRQVLSALLCEVACLSLVETGKIFYQDHATVIHSNEVVTKKLSIDPLFYDDFSNMISEINKRCELLQIEPYENGSD